MLSDEKRSPVEATWPRVVKALAESVAAAGIDLIRPFPVGVYNEVVAPELRIPDFGDPQSLAILLGSTRALWPRFITALRAHPTLRSAANPIDSYIEDALRGALARLPDQTSIPALDAVEVRFAHEPPPRRVAIQRMAEVAGLAALSPSHLCVHPDYGPWLALRAVVICPLRGPEARPTIHREPCAACPGPCLPALDIAVAAGGATHDGLINNWRLWLAVRDACPVGTQHRYSDAAIRYFYSRDRRALTDSG
jgi:methylmalonic aciduria homocystinuria type C protein